MLQDDRLPTRMRAILSRAALGLAGVLALSGFSWFSHSLVNGYYVSKPDPGAVIMAHLVEAPRGHLSGAIVVTTIDQSGSGPDVKRITLEGSIASGNVTLRTPGFFGHFRTVYIGTLESDELTLSRAGHSSFTLYLSSEARYQHRLATIASSQAKVDTYRADQRQLRDFSASLKRLMAAIPPYLAWGRARIAHQAGVKVWWEHKAKYYDACLAKIRPLAAAGVHEWRWSECAMTVRNDAWNRHQELALIQHDQRIDHVNADAIEKMIQEFPGEVRAAASTIRSMCPESPSPAKCQAIWRRETTFESMTALMARYKILRDFEQLRPQVRQALQNDAAVAAAANKHLMVVAAEITAILNDPARYRAT